MQTTLVGPSHAGPFGEAIDAVVSPVRAFCAPGDHPHWLQEHDARSGDLMASRLLEHLRRSGVDALLTS
jgi:hypothetical protein